MPPMSPPLREQVLQVAADIFGVPEDSLSEASSPDTVESWDSVQHLNLVLALESTFDIQIAPEDIEKIKSLGDAAGVVARSAR